MTKLRVIYQNQKAECGVVCLAMIAHHLNIHFPYQQVLSDYQTGTVGVNLAGLIQIAEQHEMQCRPLSLELHELSELTLPCILHWEMQHFVVLEAVAENHSVTVVDPIDGRKKLTWSEVDTAFTGVALELAGGKQAIDVTQPKVHFFTLSTSLKKSLWVLLGLSWVTELSTLIAPLFSKYVLDLFVPTSQWSLLWMLIIGALLLAAIKIASDSARQYLLLNFSAQLSLASSTKLMRHLLKQRASFFSAHSVGDLLSRFESFDNFRDLCLQWFLLIRVDLPVLVAMGVLLGMLSVPVMGIILLFGTAKVLVQIWGAIRLSPVLRANIQKSADEHAFIVEALDGASVAQRLGANAAIRSKWYEFYYEKIAVSQTLEKLKVVVQMLQTTLYQLEIVVVVSMAAWLVIQGEIGVGSFVALLSLRAMWADRLQRVSQLVINLQFMGIHKQRVMDVMAPTTKVPKNHFMQSKTALITTEDLAIGYVRDKPLQQHLSLTFRRGDYWLIKGSSGCGKSTLLKTLTGEIPILAGDISRDSELQRSTACIRVAQREFIFPLTIIENITLADPQICPTYLAKVINMTGLDTIIAQLPMGGHTLIDSSTELLSAGQLQRLFLARALVRKPHLLILDEALCHLDKMAEQHLRQVLLSLNLCLLEVSHRDIEVPSHGHILNLKNHPLMKPSQAVPDIKEESEYDNN